MVLFQPLTFRKGKSWSLSLLGMQRSKYGWLQAASEEQTVHIHGMAQPTSELNSSHRSRLNHWPHHHCLQNHSHRYENTCFLLWFNSGTELKLFCKLCLFASFQVTKLHIIINAIMLLDFWVLYRTFKKINDLQKLNTCSKNWFK